MDSTITLVLDNKDGGNNKHYDEIDKFLNQNHD